ncbi:hypothetical protein EON63_03900 [archaeon]|nr:MAG: hypothetical protein EON63_03900 [archaeon]
MAYQMFQNLEQEVSMIHMPESCFKLADRMAQFLFDPSPESYKALEGNVDLCRALNSARDIFEHDPSSIVDAVDLHVMLAEVYMLKWEDFNETMRILLVAVSLCLTSVWRNPIKALSRSNGNLDSSNARVTAIQNVHSSRSVGSETSVNGEATYVNRTRHLTRRDYLQILSLCAYATRFTTSDISFVVSFEHSRSLLLSTEYDEYESGMIDTVLWKLQAETMNVLRLLDTGKVSKAVPIMASVLEIYDAQVHSSLMAGHYSVDMIPYTLCVLSQAMIAGKELSQGIHFWHVAAEQLAQVSHPYSLVIAIISLLGTVRFTGEYDKLLNYLHAAQVLCSPGFNTLGSRFAHLLQIWLQLGIMQKTGGKMIAGSKEHTEYVALYRDFDNISQEIEAQVSSQSLVSATLGTPAVSNTSVIEMSLSKLAYIELHGCALERIYVACIGRLWSYADHANIYQLEQRLQSSLQILLQSPTYDYMSVVAKSINLLNCLIQVILTAQTNTGVSAAAIFLAVTERAEQPLLQLIQSLQHKVCVNMAWYISTLSTKLPLHDGIKDQYVILQNECMEKVVEAYTEEDNQVEFINIAESIGIDDDVADPKEQHDRVSFKQKKSRKHSEFYKPS